MWLQHSPHPLAAKAEGAGWGANHGLWLRQRGTQDSCLPSLSAHTSDCTPFLPLSLFSPEPPDRVSWLLGCASCQDCFVLPFWLPRHKIIYQNQNRTALLLFREEAGLPTGLCYSGQQGRLGLLKGLYMTTDWPALMAMGKSTHLM